MRNLIFTFVFAAICSVYAFAENYYYTESQNGQILFYSEDDNGICTLLCPWWCRENIGGYTSIVSADYYYTGDIVIPDYINIIDNKAFTCQQPSEYGYYDNDILNNVYLTSVTIPNSVTEIRYEAFYNCIGLTSVTIGDSVEVIGSEAFYNCSGLSSITIPNSVTGIGDYAFYGTGWYNNQPNGILYLSSWCLGYKGNNPTGELTINEGTRGIATDAFTGCSGFTGNLTIPSSVAYICSYAFSSCSGLTGSLTISNSVTRIGYGAFSGCRGLTSVTIGNSVPSIGGEAFYGCSGLTSVTIGNSVESIGNYAFEGCSGLISVTIGNSVTSINKNAFKGCTGLTTVNYNATNCTTMGTESYPVFANCSSFTLNIGANVAIIPENAFKGCTSFTSIVSRATNPPAIYASSFDSSLSPMTPVTVPCGTTADYQRYWYYFRNIQEDCTDVSDDYLSELSIFPNPATDILNISSPETISSIEIVNTLGQVVMQMDVNDDNAVCDVEELPNGFYVVRIYNEDTKSFCQKKFAKE